LQKNFPRNIFRITGDVNRHAEVIHKLEWITNADLNKLKAFFQDDDYETDITNDLLRAKGPENVHLEFHFSADNNIIYKLFEKNSGENFLTSWNEKYRLHFDEDLSNEEEIFERNGLPFIPPYLRETAEILEIAANNNLPKVIELQDIRGIIHTHSDWSDGGNTIEEMAKGAIAKGLEYLVISDHSQSAFYAKGLYPDRIKTQHKLIDELNEKYKPFKIFKSIESDILNDGNLDYPDSVLETFDLVITSVHSNLKMSEEKAMARLLKAISNPYTTILGHMTGRLLLSRNGYPVNHEAVINACAEHKVVIELNAHSRRLDMDWRHIPKAIDKGVLISIDPDAHAVDAFNDIRYGVLVAQKGGLTAKHNLSSFTLAEFEAFLEKQKLKRQQ
jgi:DNA polymerase (family 10)